MPESYDIRFINIGITIEKIKSSISIFGFKIAFYGIIIGIGMLAGILMAEWNAKRTGQNPEHYVDFAIYGIIFSVIGARLYYVIFSWEDYKGDLWQIFNTRGGGLAIYGGVIAAVVTLFIYTRVKKQSFFRMADTGCIGLITGQIIGRWGNFFNCEAFGGYTEGLFAMQMRRAIVSPDIITQELIDHIKVINGVEYIQVHPTFLYESVWNLIILVIMLWYLPRKKFDGEILAIYFLGYGLGRFWIESLRTDQLMFFHTPIAVSQMLSAILVAASAIGLIYKYRKIRAN